MKRMRRGILILLVVILLANLCLPVSAKRTIVYPDDWSREALIFAVENEILAGDENHDLQPSRNITRAEMSAVLVRLLGATKTTDLSAYTDVDPAAWYYGELSAAVACGIFGGVSATRMQPNHPITREQAVVVLCRAFGIASPKREGYQTFTDEKRISPYARDSVSAMQQLGLANGYADGSFGPQRSITRAEVAQLLYNIFDCIADDPSEIPSSGTVMYRGSQPLPQTLQLDGTLILGQRSAQVIAADWNITESLVLRCGADFAAQLDGLVTKKLVCAPISGTVSCPEVSELYLWGNASTYYGNAEWITVMGGVHTLSGASQNIALRGGSLTYNGDTSEATLEAGTTLILNGQASKVTILGENATLGGDGRAALIVSHPKNRTITLAYDELQDIWMENYMAEYESSLEVVQTQVIACTVEKRATLYADRAMTTQIRILEVGTTVYFEYHPDDRVYVSLDDGTKGWMMRYVCSYTDDLITTDGTLDYSEIIKEGFVNLSGYDSQTDYLIWVSRYTQKVMVYQGSKGNWELIRTFPCSTGKNETPTPAGEFEIFGHTKQWNFSDHCVRQVSSFNGGHAFHTVLLNYDGTYYNAHVGVPLSHGCVRLPIDHADYIYYQIPLHTRVVVY